MWEEQTIESEWLKTQAGFSIAAMRLIDRLAASKTWPRLQYAHDKQNVCVLRILVSLNLIH